MIIRCPYCEFSRSLNEQSIPSGAEFVTCPKCKHRFKFRSIEKAQEFSLEPHSAISSVKKEESHTDIWDAVDALHQKFEKQVGEHVAEVKVSLSEQDQHVTKHEVLIPSQQRIKENHPLKQTISHKKEKEASPKQKKKSSGFSGLLSSLPLFAHTDREAKNATPHRNNADQKKEQTDPTIQNLESIPRVIEQSKDVIDVPITQSTQITVETVSSLLDGEESSEHNEISENLFPTVSSQEKSQKPDLFSAKSEVVYKKAIEEKAVEVNILLQDQEISTEGKRNSTEDLKKTDSTALTDSVNSPLLRVHADKKKETPLLAGRVEELEIIEQVSTEENIRKNSASLEESTIETDPPKQSEPAEKETTLNDSDAFRPLFPHSKDDIPLELRLEQQLQLPLTPNDRPSKDLGRLDDITINEKSDPVYGAPMGNTLWESPISHGWCKSFLHTIHSVMFSAPSFFLKIPGNSGISLAFLFFLIQGYITILCSIFWAYAAKDLLDIPLLTIARANLPFLLLLAPLALGLILIFSAGVMRLLLEVCGARHVPFPLVARIVCYSTAPMVLSIIPFIGPLVGALWFFIAMVIAGKRVFSLSWFSSVLFTLPATFSIVAGVLVFFL